MEITTIRRLASKKRLRQAFGEYSTMSIGPGWLSLDGDIKDCGPLLDIYRVERELAASELKLTYIGIINNQFYQFSCLSSRGDQFYTVKLGLEGAFESCNCKDQVLGHNAFKGSGLKHRCKHIIAAQKQLTEGI